MRKVVRKNTKQGDVRVISGFLKGRKISVAEVDGLRPTSDRARETLFNWLQMDIVGASCLDLFAGSGALGIEAISRGAEHVSFIECNGIAYSSLQKTCIDLSIQDSCSLIYGDAMDYLARYDIEDYDMIFIDPPYAEDLLPKIINLLQEKQTKALLYIEDSSDIKENFSRQLEIIKYAKAGIVHYALARIM